MDDLINDFIAESREMLDALGGEIVAWEAAPQDKARLDAIFRFVHTVKGNSGFFDLPRLRALSHAAEDALAEVRSGRRAADFRLVSAVLAVIDRIGELVQALETGDSLASDDDEPLIAALSANAAAVEPEGPAGTAPRAQRAAVRTIRLPVDLLDRMMNGVSDLVLARNELARRLREASPGSEAEGAFDRVSATIAEMRDAITRTRMQRIDNLFAPLPRMVRDLAAETGKGVVLETDGGDVELDREMIEMIRDPLTHIVRNAIDHGIEDPAGRRAAGKAEAGSLKIVARQSGNQILIEISDDGRGVDGDRLAARAVAAGLIGAEQAGRLSPARKTALVFEPGLSTAAEVTSISGRGVGMDVVRANIERIGGLVDVDSRAGEGTCFVLRVPMTLTIIPALTVTTAGQSFAIPRSAIEEIVRPKGDAARIENVAGSTIATIRGRRMPLVPLAKVLGLAPAPVGEGSLILLKTSPGIVYALAVEQVHDHQDLVVKPAAPAVMATGLYAGTTLADDGRPVLLLDPAGLAARGGVALDRIEQETAPVAAQARPGETPHLLFAGLSGSKRAVPLGAVERIEEVVAESIQHSAGRLHVSLGEGILPLAGCGERPPTGRVRMLRLSDGGASLAYAVDRVIDIVALGSALAPAAQPGEIRGVAMVAGEQVELLDLHWLFASQGAPAYAERPLCLIPAEDPWMNTFLRPIVESAGYRVCHPGDAGADAAELAIVSIEDEAPLSLSPGRVLRIRSDPEAAGRDDDSIHRYDRVALLGALARPASRRRKGGRAR